jgi:hypothetical protein
MQTGLTVKYHIHLKGLKSQNLRDTMTEAELRFTALAELFSSTKMAAITCISVDYRSNVGPPAGVFCL